MISKLFLVAVAIFSMSQLSAQKLIINDPNATQRNVAGFSAISISGGIDLYLSQGNEDAVAVSAPTVASRDRIRTSVENGVLRILYDRKGLRFRPRNKSLVAYVSFRSINKISGSGASDIYVAGSIKGDELVIDLSGASDFKGSVQVNKLSIDQSGASDARISGSVNSLEITASGASELKAYDLESQHCTAKASGASDIKITVSKELNANASGASSIFYKGAGVLTETKSSGASSINKRS